MFPMINGSHYAMNNRSQEDLLRRVWQNFSYTSTSTQWQPASFGRVLCVHYLLLKLSRSGKQYFAICVNMKKKRLKVVQLLIK